MSNTLNKPDIEEAVLNYKDKYLLYQDDIDSLCDNYIKSLPNPDMIYKSTTFSGMLNYIYTKALKRIIKASQQDMPQSNYYNYNVLDDIFYNIYIPLCVKYNICPTVILFSAIAQIDNGVICEIKGGVYNNTGERVNEKHRKIVQKWYATCESLTVGRALNENSVGAIFVSKAVYNYSDAQTVRIESAVEDKHDTAAEIAARHAAAALPERPALEE